MKRNLCIGGIFVALIIALALGSAELKKKATVEAASVQAPIFEVDPFGRSRCRTNGFWDR